LISLCPLPALATSGIGHEEKRSHAAPYANRLRRAREAQRTERDAEINLESDDSKIRINVGHFQRRFRMAAYSTIEAVVREGKIYPLEPDKLPREGKLLLIVLNEENIKADPERIKDLIGSLKVDIDSVQWQRNIRSEWDSRL